MNRKKLVVIICTVGLTFAALFGYHRRNPDWAASLQARFLGNQAAPDPSTAEPPASDDVGKTFVVTHLRVINAGTFDLLLENGTRILARLDVMAVDDKSSTQKVVTFLNQSTNPRVVLKERLPWNPEGKIWTVDFLVTNDGKETSLADWMRQNQLVYQ